MGEMEGGISFLKRRARRRLHRPQGDGATRTLAEEGKRGAVLFFAIVHVSLSLSLSVWRELFVRALINFFYIDRVECQFACKAMS